MDAPTWRDPLPAILLLLTVTTGLVDAVSVLALGKVFVANLTGNIAFLGFAIGGEPEFSIPRCVVAVVAFMLGAALGGRLARAHENHPRRRWLLVIAAIESAVLFIAAWAAIGYDVRRLEPQGALYLMIVMTALAMGLRNATTRALAVPDMTTTVLTQTLTGLAADSWIAAGRNTRWQRRLSGVLCMFAGALIGTVLIRLGGPAVALALAGTLVLAVSIFYATHPASTAPRGKTA
ncbi:MAG: YoaK family protein [Massilia sp.]